MTTKKRATQGPARMFRLADGVRVSTRSSKPRLRKIAAKLARQADKRAGVKR